MTTKMAMFLQELGMLMDRYTAHLDYTTDDDGLHVTIDTEEVELQFPPLGHATEHMTKLIGTPPAPFIFCPLADIGHRLRTQDNRMTAHPMFCVQEKRREYGYDPRWTDNCVWIGEDGEVSKVEVAGFRRTGYKDSWHTVMVAFTQVGCEDYLNMNRHNLGETRIYVESFYRCPEMIALREWLIAASTPVKP